MLRWFLILVALSACTDGPSVIQMDHCKSMCAPRLVDSITETTCVCSKTASTVPYK